MAGTLWQSSDLLSRWNRLAGRPTADAMSNTEKYQRLADAQESVLSKIAGIVPNVLYGAPTAMTTADGGYTWTFGTDGNGYPLFPLGKAQIYQSLDAIPNYPWIPVRDYLDEGTQIRIPNNMQWSGTLYWRGITPPQEMSDTVQPILQPPSARILIVIEAVRTYAEEVDRNSGLADRMQAKWDSEFGPAMTMIRKHFRGARGLGPLTTPWGRPLGSTYPGGLGTW